MRNALIHYATVEGQFFTVPTIVKTNLETGKTLVDCRTDKGGSAGWRVVRTIIGAANTPRHFCFVNGTVASVQYAP